MTRTAETARAVATPETGRVAIAPDSFAKRALDVALSAAGVVLSTPFWVAAAVAIKLEDGGPILYEQLRWGRGGRAFRIRKFRTMTAAPCEEAGVRPARQGDLRVTRVGRVLRATGIDELPQLVSILRGEMSLVGPRALAVGERVRNGNGRLVPYDEVPGFGRRLTVRPGLTSLATLRIAKDASPRLKFRYDLLYIERRTFWLDVGLIAISVWVSFLGRWERRGSKV